MGGFKFEKNLIQVSNIITMFCSRQLACQYGNHHKVVNSNTFLDTRRDWEAIQEFHGRLYTNHILLHRQGLEPLLYHQATMRMPSVISLLKASHVSGPRPNLVAISLTTPSARL